MSLEWWGSRLREELSQISARSFHIGVQQAQFNIRGNSMKPSVQKTLIAYSVVLSTTVAIMLLMAARSPRSESFDEIRVHRINVLESDGTLRMVISDHDQMPGVIVKGKEFPKIDRPQAGLAGIATKKGKSSIQALASLSINMVNRDRSSSLRGWTTKTTSLQGSL